jgi:hypothetical protein
MKWSNPMSCDYAVWHTQSRLTDAEAIRLYDALCEGDVSGVSASPAIAAFYAEITSLHPEIDDVPDDRKEDLDFSPWSIAFDRSAGHLIMCCVWPKAEYVGRLVQTLARKHGLACFDPQDGTIADPSGLTLTADGERSRRSPSVADVEAVTTRMASDGGPNFVILEGRGEDYVQAADVGHAFTIEWREYSGEGFTHWKAGTVDPQAGNKSHVAAGDGETQVESNERLGAADLVAIFEAYLNGRSRPTQYLWRDMTEMF